MCAQLCLSLPCSLATFNVSSNKIHVVGSFLLVLVDVHTQIQTETHTHTHTHTVKPFLKRTPLRQRESILIREVSSFQGKKIYAHY